MYRKSGTIRNVCMYVCIEPVVQSEMFAKVHREYTKGTQGKGQRKVANKGKQHLPNNYLTSNQSKKSIKDLIYEA